LINEKLLEAEYFLNGIKQHYPNLDHIKPLFSAFLSASSSVPDHLLYEASVVFDLGLSKDKAWYPHHFKERVEEKSNKQAINFLKHWNEFTEKFEKTQLGKMLKNARDTNVHKYSQKPSLFAEIRIKNTSNEDDSLVLEINEAAGAGLSNVRYNDILEREKKAFVEEIKKLSKNSKRVIDTPTINLFLSFSDEQKYELRETCNEILYKMKQFDSEGRQYFS